MPVRQWYKNLPPKTRVMIGFGVMAYATAGMYLSDRIEEKLGWVATEQDLEDLRNAMPKITPVEKRDR